MRRKTGLKFWVALLVFSSVIASPSFGFPDERREREELREKAEAAWGQVMVLGVVAFVAAVVGAPERYGSFLMATNSRGVGLIGCHKGIPFGLGLGVVFEKENETAVSILIDLPILKAERFRIGVGYMVYSASRDKVESGLSVNLGIRF